MRRFMIPCLLMLLANSWPHADAEDAPRKIALKPYEAKQASIQLQVGGRPKALLFDTGEGLTMISPALARDMGCRPWGNEVGFRMLGERFEAPRCDDVVFDASDLALRARSTFVYDIAKLTGPNAPALDGAVGLDLFDRQMITLDFASGVVVMETSQSAAARHVDAVEIPLRVTRYASGGVEIFIGVRTVNGLAWMTLDSANSGPTIFVAPVIAPLLNLKAETREPQAVTLDLGNGARFEGMARVFPDMIMDGNIGMQLLKTRVITLDLVQDRAWLANETPLPSAINEKAPSIK